MKKRILSFLMMFCLIFVFAFPLVACSKNNNNSNGNQSESGLGGNGSQDDSGLGGNGSQDDSGLGGNGSQNGTGTENGNTSLTSLKLGYLADLTAEIGDATALGVQSLEIEEGSEAVAYSSVDTFSAEEMLFDEEFNCVTRNMHENNNHEENKPKKKKYLVKQSNGFSGGGVEIEDGKISKVKFKKTRKKSEEVYDENGKLIEENQTIEQDEISAQINKVYVLGNFTFMQFVPTYESIKEYIGGSSSYDNYDMYTLHYTKDGIFTTPFLKIRKEVVKTDEYGICDFDKQGYYSNDFYQSFVIDNTTGYIYKIEDITINEIKNNLLATDKGVCDLRVNENDELEFFRVVKNETIFIRDYFKDVYGNYWIDNDDLEMYDEETKTCFYNSDNTRYYFTYEGIVITIDITSTQKILFGIKNVYKLDENLNKQAISNSENYTFIDNSYYHIEFEKITDGELYLNQNDHYYNYYHRVMFTEELFFKDILHQYIRPIETLYFDGVLLDNNKIMIFQNNTLIVGNAFGENSFYEYIKTSDVEYGFKYLTDNDITDKKSEILEIADAFIEGVKLDGIWNGIETKFKKVTPSETIYYKVVEENGTWKAVNSETYIAPESTVTVKLQPLNKNK